MILLVGVLSALVTCAAGILAIVKSARPGRWNPPIWLQIGLILVSTLLSITMLYVQDRSGASTSGRLAQIREDLQNTFAIVYKQEAVHSLELHVESEGCLSQGQSGTIPNWANDLPGLVRVVTGRSPAANQTAIISLIVKYGPLRIFLWGQANRFGERWFYALATEDWPPGMIVSAAPFPTTPNQVGRFGLVNLQLNGDHIKSFVPNTPTIDRVVDTREFYLDGTFDPRKVMGYFSASLGLVSGIYDVRGLPPLGITKRPSWRDLHVPFDLLRCWDVNLKINGRSISNVMKTDSGQQDVRDRLLNFPGRMIDRKMQEGLVWLAPRPDQWSELRPLMDCNLRWVLYRDSMLPCLITGKP